MPEGQFTGSRATYLYVSDSGTNYLLTLDTTLGDAPGTGLARATTGNVGNAIPAPKRFKPRVVYWQGYAPDGSIKRKRLVCNRAGGIYETQTPTNMAVDGIAGSTTGRRGEKLSFSFLPIGPAPAP